MTTRTVEITDNLESIISSLMDDVAERVEEYLTNSLTQMSEGDSLPDRPDASDLDYGGEIHSLIDSAVPIYTKEIEDLWYLYKNEFIEAYENAGCGDNPYENNGMDAIYFYLSEQVYQRIDNLSIKYDVTVSVEA